MSAFSPRRCAVLVAPVLALGGVLLGAAPASAASSSVLLNEVYGGGGNSGATWRNDFVELFNHGDTAVDLTGWQVQYWSAGAASGAKPAGTTPLTGSIAPGGHFLIHEAAGANASAAALPAPDATGTINLSGTGGPGRRARRIRCRGGPARLGAPPRSPRAAPPRPRPTPAPPRATTPVSTPTTNAADFASVAPTPQNSATPHEDCVAPPPVARPTIAEIQGTSHLSPLANKPVAGVPGIVTVLGAAGLLDAVRRPRTPTPAPARASTSSPAPHRPSRSATA